MNMRCVQGWTSRRLSDSGTGPQNPCVLLSSDVSKTKCICTYVYREICNMNKKIYKPHVRRLSIDALVSDTCP